MLKWIKYLCAGIAWGCTFFVFTLLIGGAFTGGSFLEIMIADFYRQAAGAIVVGVACGTTSIVYTMERFSFAAQVLIHAGIGIPVYLLVAFWLKWIPSKSAIAIVSSMVFGILAFAGIWLGFYILNRAEAKAVNKRLKEIEDGIPAGK